MPNTKSAIRRTRRVKIQTTVNKIRKSKYRSAIRQMSGYLANNKMKEAKEFLPKDFICDPTSQAIVNKIEELNKEYKIKRELAFEFGKKYKDKFNKISIAKNILKIKK